MIIKEFHIPNSEGDIIFKIAIFAIICEIELNDEKAPITVENFLGYVKDGFYDGLIFHRVINDFMIQGGDPDGTGRGGQSIWGRPFEDEFSMEYRNLRGALSMANAGPKTNGSQFFIVQKGDIEKSIIDQMKQLGEAKGFPGEVIEAYEENGGTYWLDGKHTVFGQVFDGMDVVDKIAHLPVGRNDMPKEPVMILTIEITNYEG